jgi:hypothetical protein
MPSKRKRSEKSSGKEGAVKRVRRDANIAPSSKAKREERSVANSMITLLSLPGELRNMIYEHVLNGFYADNGNSYSTWYRPYDYNPAVAATRRDELVNSTPYRLVLSREFDKLYVTQRRNYVALGQICRALRQEIRSLDASTTSNVVVPVEDLCGYIDVAYPPNDATTMVGYRGSIFVKMYHDSRDMYDLLPLMKLLRQAPHLNCEVFEGRWEVREAYDVMCSQILFGTSSSLLAAVLAVGDCKVERVMFRRTFISRVSLEIWFKPEHAPDWMTNTVHFGHLQWARRRASKLFSKEQLARLAPMHQWFIDAGISLQNTMRWDVTMGVAHN